MTVEYIDRYFYNLIPRLLSKLRKHNKKMLLLSVRVVRNIIVRTGKINSNNEKYQIRNDLS